jgi:SAM-dependent methyltransferase
LHPAALQWAKLHVPELPTQVVDIGGADINCSLRNLYTWSGYTCVDIAPGPGVDVVADFVTWAASQPPESCDLVVCFEVLEHAEDWRAIVGQARRLLIRGGRFVGTCATGDRPEHSAYGLPRKPADEHYVNVPLAEFAESLVMSGFDDFTIDVTRSGMDLRWDAAR